MSLKKEFPAEYRALHAAKTRCRNPNSPEFHNYGGRGIKVCPRWESFENFLADMGPKPSPELVLGRLDVNGDYEPTNCAWLPIQRQTAHRRCCRRIILDGEDVTIKEAARKLNLPDPTFRERLLRIGLPVSAAKVRWLPNHRSSRYMEHNGKRQTLAAWAKEAGMPLHRLRNRLNSGWPPELALLPGAFQGRKPPAGHSLKPTT